MLPNTGKELEGDHAITCTVVEGKRHHHDRPDCDGFIDHNRPLNYSTEAKNRHLVLFGTPANNPFIADVADKLPVTWKGDAVVAGKRSFPAATHLPVLIHPNPLSPEKYVVLNSGPTFREAHDRTNSLQNPKLPDWAILDLTQPPDAEAAGKVVAADFLDERWQLKPARDN